MRIKGAILLLAAAVALMGSGGSLYASCGSLVIAHGTSGTTSFVNCGTAPIAFAWTHKFGVQRVLAALTVNTSTPAGHDSGANQTQQDQMFVPGAAPGQWFGVSDFGNPGWNGCAFVVPDQAASVCTGAVDPPVLDYALAGVDPAAPNIARLAVLSVDFNEFFGSYVLDQAGAAAGDGDPCSGDAFQFRDTDVSCMPIPAPVVAGAVPGTCSVTGCNVNVTIPDVTSLVANALVDDCNVAEDKATNCPRNLYQGRALLFRHGACTRSTGQALDQKTWVYPAPPASGTLATNGQFFRYAPQDANLNGIQDGAEVTFAPVVFTGTTVQTANIRVPAVAGANDCIFFALGILLDAGGGNLGTSVGESAISPLVSIDVNPVRAGDGTPVTDVVGTINANKSQGKGTVSWSTGIETITSGFNVIGTKKGGGNETKLNASIIPAKEGTTGKGADYTVTFDASQLKGSSSIYIEIVRTDGSKERFGPASF